MAFTTHLKALGPLVDADSPPVPLGDVERLRDALTVGNDSFGVTVSADLLIGLLGPFNTRARAILVALLRGYSRGMAATTAGIAEATLDNWEKRVPEFREATVQAHQMGFRRTFEPELYRRAMAGNDDRGSMRALELVTKARDSAYRDKSQLQMEVVHRAGESMTKLVGGWTDEAAPQTPDTA